MLSFEEDNVANLQLIRIMVVVGLCLSMAVNDDT